MKVWEKEAIRRARFVNLFKKGLDLEEIITISGLEELRESVLRNKFGNRKKRKMIKIINHLTKDTLKHIKIFKDLIKNFENG